MKLYRTRTRGEYDFLMQKLEDEGYKWAGVGEPTIYNHWKSYEEETVIHAKETKNILFGSIDDLDELSKSKVIEASELMKEQDPIQPTHYRKGEIDLFESAYRTRPFNEFRAIMEFVAERYMKRDKNDRVEDLNKAIYTLERLKEYEKQR